MTHNIYEVKNMLIESSKEAYQSLYHSVGGIMDKIDDGKLLDAQQIRLQLYEAMLNAEEKLHFS